MQYYAILKCGNSWRYTYEDCHRSLDELGKVYDPSFDLKNGVLDTQDIRIIWNRKRYIFPEDGDEALDMIVVGSTPFYSKRIADALRLFVDELHVSEVTHQLSETESSPMYFCHFRNYLDLLDTEKSVFHLEIDEEYGDKYYRDIDKYVLKEEVLSLKPDAFKLDFASPFYTIVSQRVVDAIGPEPLNGIALIELEEMHSDTDQVLKDRGLKPA